MKITRTADKVLFWTNHGIKAFSQECNIFSHPRSEKAILIAEAGTGQNESDSFVVDYDNLEDYNDTAFPVANRDEMIEILANRYFNENYRIDDTRFLDENGDGSGNKNFKYDYANSLTKALIKPKTNGILHINRLVVFVADSGSVDAGMYGNNIILSNGIEIKHEKQDGTLIKDITDGMPIKTNADYAKFGFQVSDISFGSGLNYIHAVLTFNKNGTGITLQPDEQLAIYFHDSFTKLVNHTFRAGAYYLE